MILRRTSFTKPVLNYSFLVKASSLCSKTFQHVNSPSVSVADRQTPLPNYSSKVVNLSPLVSNDKPYVGGYNIELVDNDAWQVSSGLAQAWRGLDNAIQSNKVDEEEVFDGSTCVEGDSDFDEIDNMRVRGNLFYKLDRNSKEFEEYSFEFHRRKGSKQKCDDRKETEKKKPLENKQTLKNPLRGSVPENANVPRFARDDEKVYALAGDINYSRAEKMIRTPTFNQPTGPCDHKQSEKHELSKNPIRSSVPARVNIQRIPRGDEKVYALPGDINYSRAEKMIRPPTFNQPTGPYDHKQSEKHEFLKNPIRISDPSSVNIPRIASDDEKVYTLGDDIKYPREKRIRTQTFNQLTGPYHEPFCLDIFVSNASVRACIVHRATSKVVAVAHSISKDLKFDLGSTKSDATCASVGVILAQRALEDDIHNVIYTPRKGDKLEGKLQIVLKAVMNNGINVKVKLKQRKKKFSY